MHLQRLFDDSAELMTLARAESPFTSPDQWEAEEGRIEALIHSIRETAVLHNIDVVHELRLHHPEQPHIRPDQTTAARELMSTTWSRVEVPDRNDCCNSLDADTESSLQDLTPERREAYRFARRIWWQAGTLLLHGSQGESYERTSPEGNAGDR